MAYEVSTIGDVGARPMTRARARSLAMGSVATVVTSHGGPYVIFAVGAVMGLAIGSVLWKKGKGKRG